MAKPSSDISSLGQHLSPYGLTVLGVDGHRVLAGNAGSDMWMIFRDSDEYRDGLAHPLDRWTRRIGSRIAGDLGARAVFPFEGPPWPPFLRWAKASGQVFTSPLSMGIHTRHGLWHAYRFALVFDEAPESKRPVSGRSPCLDCRDKPCLQACPVNAFVAGEYRVSECLAYLEGNPASDCRQRGCQARMACPAALRNRYDPEHARFHMAAFLRARPAA